MRDYYLVRLFKRKDRMKMPIRKKLFIALLLVSIPSVLLVTFLAERTLYTALYNQIKQSGEASIGYIHDRLETSVNDFSEHFYELEVNKEFKNNILTWCSGKELEYSKQWGMIRALNTVMSLDGRVNSIEIKNLYNGQTLVAKRSGAKLIDSDDDYDVWGSRDASLQTNIVFRRDGDELIIMHQMNQFETGRALAVVIMHVRYSVLENLFEELVTDPREEAFLLNDENEIVAFISGQAMDNSSAGETTQIENIPLDANFYREDSKYYFSRSVSNDKLRVVQSIPEEIISAAMHQTLSSGILVGALCLIAAMVLSAVLSKIISNPIVELAETMKTLSVNDFAAEKNVRREDEIGLLQNSFYSMIARNQDLIYCEYRSNIEKHQAQIHALQAQINPHFLHNSLQVIGGMALKRKGSEIYDITVALSDMMRYTLNFSREMVPIREEIKYIQSYLNIQNARFQNRIIVDMDISEELLIFLVPKLMLQPIIENSFEHGLKDKAGDWLLRILGSLKEKDIFLQVSDNGVGISENKLIELRRTLSDTQKIWDSGEHIGLANVNTRIKLRFGEKYGLKIFSREGEGTTVEFLMKGVTEVDGEI